MDIADNRVEVALSPFELTSALMKLGASGTLGQARHGGWNRSTSVGVA